MSTGMLAFFVHHLDAGASCASASAAMHTEPAYCSAQEGTAAVAGRSGKQQPLFSQARRRSR
jgi:hypothetical protein